MIDKTLNWGREQMAKLLQQALPFSSILDIGAGQGTDLDLAHAAAPNAKMFAVESYAPYLEILQQKDIKVFPLNVEREQLPFSPESLDVVMANQVMEHLKEIFWILHETSRVLKVGGHILVGVPNLASLHNRLLLAAGRQPTSIQNHSAHVRGYTKHDLLSLLETIFPGGYQLRGFLGSNFYPLLPALARPAAALFPNAAVSIFLLLEKKMEYHQQFIEFPADRRLETNFYLGEEQIPRDHNHIV